MIDYLPDIYQRFRERHPQVADALDALGAAVRDAGPLDDRTQHLVKLGLAIGSVSNGAVRSHVRRALDDGITPDEIRHVATLATTTCGFSTAIAGHRWIEQVLENEVD